MAKNGSKSRPGITTPRGFRAAGGTCGIKASGKPDLALIVADGPCSAAGVFTTNRMPGAPVIVGRRHVRGGVARAIVCNSGCSNVCTGERGLRDAMEMCELVARHTPTKTPIDPRQVLPNSTGVIGKYLPMDKLRAGIAALAPTLARGPEADEAAARAIMTTDLVPKVAYRRVTLGGAVVHLAGIAKGSGMIAPNMATMFAFITTDAAIAPRPLKASLKAAVDSSFNRLSVDMDTSTSDAVLILASGAAGNPRIDGFVPKPAADYREFVHALTDLCRDLAYQVVKDGEGATKVFRVEVQGARTQRDADAVGRTVVGSPLVKTAVHGGDPNWGRLVMAVGRSGAYARPDKLTIYVGDVCVGRNGFAVELPKRARARVNKLMAAQEITFRIDLGVGKAATEWLGCDLSREYIAINADYTT